MTTPLPSVSLVLPVHRTGAELDRCLRAVAALDPAPVQVVVVVDGAAPDVVARVQEVGTLVLALPEQGGPARARNRGAAQATGDVLLFIDADVEVSPDLVARVAGYLGEHPDVDALIGSYDDQPGASNFLSQYKNLLNHHVHQRSRTEGYTFWGACGAVRRARFAALGGFDETYVQPSIEDIELGYRLCAAGGRVHVVRDIQVKHLKRWGVRSLLVADVARRALPWSELILRTGGFDAGSGGGAGGEPGGDLNIDRAGRAKVAVTGLGLLGLLGARHRAGRAAVGGSAVALLVLDAPLLAFYRRQRGARFAAATVPWTWLSYAYSGAAFGWVVVRRAIRRAA